MASSTRRSIEAAVGYRLDDEAWAELVDQGWEDSFELDPDDAVRRLRRLRPARARLPVRAGAVEMEDLVERSEALSAWAARLAREDRRVQRWRYLHPPLDVDEVAFYVRAEFSRANDFPFRQPLSVEDPDGEWTLAGRWLNSHEVDCVHWWEKDASGETHELRWPAPESGALWDLLLIINDLVGRFGWDRGEAAMFALTDHEPVVAPVWHGTTFVTPTSYSRVRLVLDLAMTAEQVARVWREIRSESLEAIPRSQDRKHQNLAGFMASREPASSWEQERLRWNDAFPDWRYDDRANFARESRLAVQRMLHLSVRW